MLMRIAVILVCLAASPLHAQTPALNLQWATACHEPLDPAPVFVPKSLETILLPGQCMAVTGERSGYDGGFSPITDGDRLLLFVTGRTFVPGTYRLTATAKLDVPRCIGCDGWCVKHSEYQVTGFQQALRLDEAGQYLVFDLENDRLFPQWELLGVEIGVELEGPGLEGERAVQRFAEWPWCT
tara:strand:- start:1801 stop:2349 length:549 start_codon:yes stop_codon:yes gene_type:complete